MGLKDKMMEGMMNNMSSEEKKAMMDAMMEKFMSDLKPDDKQEMMDGMMSKFMGSMTEEEKQKMMQNMMSSMMGEKSSSTGGGMMDMMGKMMGGNSSMGGGMMGNMMKMMMGSGNKSDETNSQSEMPWDMCKKMMSGIGSANQLATYATPEIRQLFEEWVVQIEEEILEFVKKSESIDIEKISSEFKLSTESTTYILTRLAQKGKIKFKKDAE